MMLEITKSSFEVSFGLLMPTVELFQHVSDLLADLELGQRADTSDDAQHAIVTRWLERSQDDALTVGRENDSGSFDWQDSSVSWVGDDTHGGMKASHFGE